MVRIQISIMFLMACCICAFGFNQCKIRKETSTNSHPLIHMKERIQEIINVLQNDSSRCHFQVPTYLTTSSKTNNDLCNLHRYTMLLDRLMRACSENYANLLPSLTTLNHTFSNFVQNEMSKSNCSCSHQGGSSPFQSCGSNVFRYIDNMLTKHLGYIRYGHIKSYLQALRKCDLPSTRTE